MSKKILLVQLSFLGDVVLSTPLIKAIKELHPDCELVMLTTPAANDLVRRDPLLDSTLIFDKRVTHRGILGLLAFAKIIKSQSFDIVYSLHRSYRTSIMLWLAKIPVRYGFKESKAGFLYTNKVNRAKSHGNKFIHDVEKNLSLLPNWQNLSDQLRIFPASEKELSEEVGKFIKNAGKYIVVAPGSVWKTKAWATDGYRQVAEYYLKQGLKVAVIGAKADQQKGSAVSEDLSVKNFIGKTSIGESIALIKNAKLVFCNDSMVLHLASALKTPNIAIFCATSPSFGFGPWQNQAKVIELADLKCKPCRRHGSNACPTGTEACMRLLPAENVISAADSLRVL